MQTQPHRELILNRIVSCNVHSPHHSSQPPLSDALSTDTYEVSFQSSLDTTASPAIHFPACVVRQPQSKCSPKRLSRARDSCNTKKAQTAFAATRTDIMSSLGRYIEGIFRKWHAGRRHTRTKSRQQTSTASRVSHLSDFSHRRDPLLDMVSS
jgi:hypothetical protein